jgi:hypothetical protein
MSQCAPRKPPSERKLLCPRSRNLHIGSPVVFLIQIVVA